MHDKVMFDAWAGEDSGLLSIGWSGEASRKWWGGEIEAVIQNFGARAFQKKAQQI